METIGTSEPRYIEPILTGFLFIVYFITGYRESPSTVPVNTCPGEKTV
jgi:hypothetical protein